MLGFKERLLKSRLYVLLSNISAKEAILEKAQLVLDGGADIIQLREKTLSDKEFISVAEDLLNLTSKRNAILIINDRVHIAKQINAEGVHIGQGDMKLDEARSVLGNDTIIGVSTHSLQQAIEAECNGADYIGIGPAFPTKTKDYEPAIDISIVNDVVKNIKIPIFAIGGINLSNIDQVLKTGVSKIVVSSAIIESEEVVDITKKFKTILVNI